MRSSLMATSTFQPILDTPERKNSSLKTFLFLLSLTTILGSIALLVSLLIINSNGSNSFYSLKTPNICEHALDQSSCLAMVSEVTPTLSSKINKIEVLQMILHKTSHQIQETTRLIKNVHLRINDKREQKALANCIELNEMSLESVTDSMVALGNLTYSAHFDVHMWLSSVLTDHDTCMDMLHGQSRAIMKPMLKNLMSRASTALALIVSITPISRGANKEFPTVPISSTKSSSDYLHKFHGQFPKWVSPTDRNLLEASANSIKPNVVVSKNGNGDYETINEALENAPTNSKERYVIYIKKGTYEENVVLASNQRNIMFLGDGCEDTIITGSLNHASGTGTFDTPTIASNARDFIAQDLCIQNTAGPEGDQAVALRVTGDFSVINRCKIDAYQDSLYVHNRQQFYKDCYITGTVDFIFGNAAVVLQKCKIVARRPGKGQNNMVTAQSKSDPNQITGISIQDCQITPSDDLAPVKEQFKTFLGRPWKRYATVVVMQSYIDDHVDPAGWAPWPNVDYSKDVYCGEYKNKGPGADTSNRVTWKGFHVITKA